LGRRGRGGDDSLLSADITDAMFWDCSNSLIVMINS
jgi:hypothetical protein